jgi:aryl sulfotransferase
MTNYKPERIHHYQNLFMDSARWDGFSPRKDDIFVCTPYKSGTTWTQMICALVIFQKPDLPARLSDLSPWLDNRISPIKEILERYEGQSHRRFIKTHTPLDGIPYFEDATYLYCGRDPREIFVSVVNHAKNHQIDKMIEALEKQGVSVEPPEPPPEDVNEWFELWLTQPAFPWEEDGFPFWSVFSHAKTFWKYRDLPNIHFLHYADLKADLNGQMRRIAGILGIQINEEIWPQLIEAATFDSMKRNADMTAPEIDRSFWRSNVAFFHKGEHAQWRGFLNEKNLDLYESVKMTRGEPKFLEWFEKGSLATGISLD